VMDKNREVIVKTIPESCHPTGAKPRMEKYEIRKVGDTFSVDIRVNWRGAFNAEHTSVVIWEFKQSGHIRAAVTAENAAFGVAPVEARRLDEWFRTQLYATLRTDMGD